MVNAIDHTTLNTLSVGDKATIVGFKDDSSAFTRRLKALGFINDKEVEIKRNVFGIVVVQPSTQSVTYAIRKEDTNDIFVNSIKRSKPKESILNSLKRKLSVLFKTRLS